VSVPIIKTSLIAGEVSPSMFGHVDLARMQGAASTMRNGWPSFHGGYYSRAGTAFVGFSKQTGRTIPPRLLPFQFSVSQGLALEFGNFYMRVIKDGAFVSDVAANLTSVSNTNPAVIGFNASGFAAASAVPVNTGTTQSYAPGDTVTLAGGTGVTTPSVLSVTNTKLVNLALAFGGGSLGNYTPADTIHLTGGTQSTPAVLTVTTTQAAASNIVNAGTGGVANTSTTITGTTGTGTKIQARVQIDPFGRVSAILGTVSGGSYTANPSNPAAEPFTGGGGGLSGVVLNLDMGVNTFALTNAGVFTTNAAGGTFTQASSSGSGLGATFNGALFGPHAVTVAQAGIYASYPANPVAQASTSGSGLGATFTVTTTGISIAPFKNGDWLDFAGVGGAVQLNGNTFVLQNVTPNSAQLYDVYGNPVDATAWGAYTSGGVASRLYTLSTIYSENDLLWLKPTESADVMSLCAVNQTTQVEYPPQDLQRLADDDWQFVPVVPAPSVLPPASVAGAASSSGSVDYAYVVTSIAADGSESIASPIANVASAVDIAATAGSITVTWPPAANATGYNVYKASPAYGVVVPAGSLFGYAGTAFGTQLVDGPSAIVPDLVQVPPTHQNPFARGQIVAANVLTSSGTVTTVGVAINTSTGSGGVIVPVIVNSVLVALIVEEPGELYQPGDTITLTVTGGGSATGSITVGAETGTYPGTVAYFQERRAYAYSINNPDTYWMSQPGAFTNFDTRSPPVDSDAITGSPWSVQVNGIQWMIQTSGGLLVFTGLQTWLLVGAGSFATNATPISPTSQDANPQPEIGCSPTLKPIKINYDVIFADSMSQFYYDQPYQLYTLSEPIAITQLASHLFKGFNFLSHDWCRNSEFLFWAVRNDGVMLSLTWLKAEQVQGWARHDTQGLFKSNAAVFEPPVDALYLAVQRFPPTYGTGQNTYMIERMDNRLWPAAENVWAVDCGLALGQSPGGTALTASSAVGLGACSGVTNLVGGKGWSAGTTAKVIDANGQGPGTGAIPALTIVGGVITAVSFAGNEGTKYVYPELEFDDPAGSAGGSGASATITLDNSATFTASGVAFPNSGVIGQVIRLGGGIAKITAWTDTSHVTANILVPITATIPGSTAPLTAPPGSWTLTPVVSSVSGLRHLAGLAVTGLVDGNVLPLTTVDAFGNVAFPGGMSGSAVILGLGFQAQLQGVYLLEAAVQGARKKVADVTVRMEASRGVKIGTNQVDGSTLSPPQLAPVWSGLTAVPDKAVGAYNSLCQPLYTGDVRQPVFGGFATPGQVALQQDNPLPMQVTAYIPEYESGDLPQQQWPKKEQKGQQ
jgi:hypothetical protein